MPVSSTAEIDVILNRANVALARSQRLVASWLPPKTQAELANSTTEEEVQRKEDEIFTPVPATLGLGAPIPSPGIAVDGSTNRAESSSNEKLRKQLLGRNYKKVQQISTSGLKSAATNAGKPGVGISQSPKQGSSSIGLDDQAADDEEGRTAAVGMTKKRKISAVKRNSSQSGAKHGEEHDMASTTTQQEHSHVDDDKSDKFVSMSAKQGTLPTITKPGKKNNKKAISFLDEILAERAQKRKKK